MGLMIVVLHWIILAYTRKKFTSFGTHFNRTDVESQEICGRDSDSVNYSANTLLETIDTVFRKVKSKVKGFC
jgi:hypothetical protein